MTRDEMMERMSSTEFSTWMAKYNISPFGAVRDDLRAGMIASPLINIQLAKGETRTKPGDWILDKEPEEPQDPATMAVILKGLAHRAADKPAKPKQKPAGKKPRR